MHTVQMALMVFQFSAAIPGIVYALLGTSRQLNVAPEAALSLLVGQAVDEILHSDPHHHPINPDAVAIAISTIITFQVCSMLLSLVPCSHRGARSASSVSYSDYSD